MKIRAWIMVIFLILGLFGASSSVFAYKISTGSGKIHSDSDPSSSNNPLINSQRIQPHNTISNSTSTSTNNVQLISFLIIPWALIIVVGLVWWRIRR